MDTAITRTPSTLDAVCSAITAAPTYHGIAPSHAEFVDWGRTTGLLNGRVVDFLASRDDGAGATPAEWTRLSAALDSDWHQLLSEQQRHDFSAVLIGTEALNAFADWARVQPA